nr:MAG TPA: hypothetical protein [Caudoviricetes sp.]
MPMHNIPYIFVYLFRWAERCTHQQHINRIRKFFSNVQCSLFLFELLVPFL